MAVKLHRAGICAGPLGAGARKFPMPPQHPSELSFLLYAVWISVSHRLSPLDMVEMGGWHASGSGLQLKGLPGTEDVQEPAAT